MWTNGTEISGNSGKSEKKEVPRKVLPFPVSKTFHRDEPFHLNSPRNIRKFYSNVKRSCKGSPVFALEICFPFTEFSSLSPVPCLSRPFKRPGLPRVGTKMAADHHQTSGSRVSFFVEACCKQTFRATKSALPA